MIDDEDENLVDDWAAALGDSEDGDDLADEWAAMAEGGGDDGFSIVPAFSIRRKSTACLVSRKVMRLRPNDLASRRSSTVGWCPTNACQCWRSCLTVLYA